MDISGTHPIHHPLPPSAVLREIRIQPCGRHLPLQSELPSRRPQHDMVLLSAKVTPILTRQPWPVSSQKCRIPGGQCVLRGAPKQKPAHRLAAACTMRTQIGREPAAQCGSDGTCKFSLALTFNPAILLSHIGWFFDVKACREKMASRNSPKSFV